MAVYVRERPATPVYVEQNSARPNTDSGYGFLIGLIILLIVGFLVFYYGIPALRGSIGGTTVNVPKSIDVNVNNPPK